MSRDILVLEAFYGGSHKQLVDALTAEPELASRIELRTMPATKWHWRARTAAMHFADDVPNEHEFKFLLASSVRTSVRLSQEEI